MIRLLFASLAIALLILSNACSADNGVNEEQPQPVVHPSTAVSAQPNASAQSTSAAKADSAISADLPPPLLERLKAFLSQQTGVPIAQIQLKAAEAVEWNDSCLGLARPDEMCLMVITPGYRVMLSTPTTEYVVHSDRTHNFRLASPQ